MITEISLSNFKSWEKIEKMRFAPITALFGTNSSGKTSIFQLLLILKQTVESTDRLQVLDFGDEKKPANLGGFNDVVFSHEKQREIDWSIRWKLKTPLQVPDPEDKTKYQFEGDEIGFTAEVSEDEKKRLNVEQIAYMFAEKTFIMKRKSAAKNTYELLVQPQGDFRFTRTKGRVWDLPAPVKCYGFPNEVNAYYQNAGFMADLQLAFERLFNGIKYLGPLRDHPKRQYSWSGGEPVDMGQRGERVFEAILAARESNLLLSRGRGKRRESLEERVAKWLKDLNLIESFKIEPIAQDSGNIYRVLVRRSAKSPHVLITDVGFGVSQILPAIVLCYYAPEGSTIILEQPEIHLHPAIQAGLADVFIDAVKTRDIQVAIESHSEHLLRRLQRRIADGSISRELMSLYFCESVNGGSKLTSLELDLFGNISNWPKDFFGDQFGEMAEMTKAAMARKAI